MRSVLSQIRFIFLGLDFVDVRDPGFSRWSQIGS